MKPLGRLGVWYPIDRLDGAGTQTLAERTVEELGYLDVLVPGSARI